ncbi:MAG: hypothetical protein AN485_17590 [Anabaena sp. MDT14b]|jgi:hypothetical protein|nr:MAG: hypothetical protein AN485_17590 [Anabaena sp. MDT14b]
MILEEGVRSQESGVKKKESGVRSQESGGRRKKKEEKSPIIVQILFIVNPYIRSFLILNSDLLIA